MFDLKKFRPMFDADSGGGGGAPASTTTPPAATSTEPPAAPGTSATPPSTTTPPASGGAPAGGTAAEPVYSKAQVESIVKERLSQNERSAAEKAEKDARLKVETELKENQKFKELSEVKTKEAETLSGQVTTLTEQLTAANEALTNYAKADFDKLPPYIQTLLTGQQPAQVLKYITDNRAVLFPTTTTTDSTTTPPAVPGDPSAKPVDEAVAKRENEADIRSMLG
jgi:hypothetical protein